MPDCSIWDVARVPFPYADRPVRSHRPVLVVALPEGGGVAWLLMITAAENTPWPGDVAVRGLRRAGLPIASVIRCAKIATVDIRQIERIGRLGSAEQDGVRRTLSALLAGVS